MLNAPRSIAFTALLLAAACRETTSPTATLLRTDSTTYTAIAVGFSQVEVRLLTTYRNPSDTAIAMDRCTPKTPYPTYFVDLVAPKSSEGAGYNPGWACVGHDSPIVVGPGAIRTDTITLHGPAGFDPKANKYLGVIEGRFRINYGGQYSNEFTIKLPPGGVRR